MSAEGESNNLFEEDLTTFADDISQMIGENNSDDQNNQDNQDSTDDQDTGYYNQDEEDDGDIDNGSEEGGHKDESDEDKQDGEGADSSSSEQGKDADDSPSLAPYARLLVDEGVLPNLNLEEFDGTAESLVEAARNEVDNGVQTYKQSLPEEVQRFIEGYESGIDLNQLVNFTRERTKYNEISEDNLSQDEDLQKQLVRDYYKRTSKFSDERIEKTIERVSDLGELEDEAKSSLNELVELQSQEEEQAKQQAQEQQEAIRKQQQEQIEEFNKTLENTNEVIPGIKVNNNLKETIRKNITTPVAYDQQGNPVNKIGKYRAENPIDFEIKLNYLFEATKGFTDFNLFGKKGKSQAIKELEEAARVQDSRASGKGSKTSVDGNVKDTINDFLSNF